MLLLGCSTPAPADSAADPLCACAEVPLPEAPVAEEAGLATLLASVQSTLYADADAVRVDVDAVDDLQFFRAWIDIATVTLPPDERAYVVQYDPVLLEDPPEPDALAAILAHELGHVEDYLAMDATELVEFGLWYAAQDPAASEDLAAYERATDEKALDRGCGEGLAAMRVWIYAHVDAEGLAEKERNYYTPDEIAAWMEAHGRCRAD